MGEIGEGQRPLREQPAGPGLPTFERLVADTSVDLYRLATRLTGEAADAADVLQSTYLQAFEALRAGQYRGECRLETWLYRIATRVAFDARRTARRRARLEEASARPEVASERIEASVELGELRVALESLPEDQRVALVLKELHGLSGRQTAEVMERTEGAVEQLLVRARAQLRKRYEP